MKSNVVDWTHTEIDYCISRNFSLMRVTEFHFGSSHLSFLLWRKKYHKFTTRSSHFSFIEVLLVQSRHSTLKFCDKERRRKQNKIKTSKKKHIHLSHSVLSFVANCDVCTNLFSVRSCARLSFGSAKTEKKKIEKRNDEIHATQNTPFRRRLFLMIL